MGRGHATGRRVGQRWGFTRLRAALAGLVIITAACGSAEFEAFARDICAENDGLDVEFREKLPTRQEDVLRDINYLDKLQDIRKRKQALKQKVDEYEAPITRNALRNKLAIALNNSIRYLSAMEQQYAIAKERWEKLGGDEELPSDPYDADTAIRQLTTQRAVYSVDPRELLMKRQYEKLYAEVRAQLGLEALGFDS